MSLLLLLSAMFTALSGAGAGVRAPQVPVAVAGVVAIAEAVSPAAARQSGRPVAAPPVARAAVVATLTRWRLTPTMPLYLSRRRE